MISLISRKKPTNEHGNKPGYRLVAIEESLFWGGLAALAFGSGWIAVLGGIALGISILIVVFLLAYA